MTFILDLIEFAVYAVLALALLIHFRREPDLKRLHISLAFGIAALGFLFNVADDLLYFAGYIEIAKFAFKSFDILLMIGAFYFFVFLSDFNERLKKIKVIWYVALLGVIAAIAYLQIDYVIQGSFWTVVRSPAAGLALVFYWTVTFAIISASFVRYAALAKSRVAKYRMWFLALGGIAAVLSYLSAVFFKFSLPNLLIASEMTSSTLAVVAGIFFYLGAEMPARLKKAFE
ncbi:MAG: hypothetical protein WC891_00355 [Actinomycetota bacterium]